MDFYKVVENRKSIKTFKKGDLDKGKIDRIINASMIAQSWKNKT